MLTSEMIAMLEKNPKLKFTKKCAFGYGGAVTCEDGRLVGLSGDYYAYVLDGRNKPMENWELVRESVPGWEAIKALTEGKTLECDYNGGISKIKPNDCGGLSIQSLRRGTWYIEQEVN